MTLSEKSYLVLGWRTTPTIEPAYWVEGKAELGLQSIEDLVRIPAETIAGHTAIIAQSGSGKSFFLGRLVEEIIIRTRARCIVLDPNADFRRVHEVEDASLWSNAAYDRLRRRGKLPHERSRKEFARLWPKRRVRIRTGSRDTRAAPYEKLQVSWPSLSMDVLAEDIDPMLRSDLYHCHMFVQDLAELHHFRDTEPIKTRDLIEEAEQLLRQARISESDFRDSLQVKYKADDMLRSPTKERVPPYLRMMVWGPVPEYFVWDKRFLNYFKSVARSRISSLIESLVRAPKYVSQTVEHFYFSKARGYETAGIISPEISGVRQPPEPQKRLDVVDLPSLKDQGTRLLAINAIMTTEWDDARARWAAALREATAGDTRAPTFIVIDEAHNLIPAEPRTKAEAAVREIFRTIVAEGRKYGLFVVLVSQRPDKLDPLVLSECENKAVMKLSSGSVLAITRNLLGLDDVHPKVLEKCLECDVGRVLLVGRWAPSGPQFIYAAARRTVEGGRNLREDYWAVPGDRVGVPHRKRARRKPKRSGRRRIGSASGRKKRAPGRKRLRRRLSSGD
jgi:hypothetical protein